MARHNREGRGKDQKGVSYVIGYQPDWLSRVKVTRSLANGRQSTKTLFRNPGAREQPPGPRVRTRISSADRKLDFEIGLDDPNGVVQRIMVEAKVPGRSQADNVVFTIHEISTTDGS